MAEIVALNPSRPVLPQSIEAEQQVLGALLLDQTRAPIVGQGGGADLFFDPVHADLYRRIATMERDGLHVSPVTLRDWAAGHEGFAELGGVRYLARLAASAVMPDDVQAYVDHLAEMRSRRRLMEAIADAQQALTKGELAASHIAGQLEASIMTVEGGTGRKPVSMLAAATKAAQQVWAAHNGEAVECVPTGIRALDRLLTGLFPGEMILLGGRPSMGKTAVAINIGVNAARAGKKVAFCSLEMTPDAVALRCLSEALAANGRAVAYRDLRGGDLRGVSGEHFAAAVEDVARLPIHFLPREYQDVGALLSGAKRARAMMRGLDLVIVDYVQLMKASQAKSRYEIITEVSTALKGLAGQLNVPVLALSQLSRAVEQREDKRPRMDDLRESGQLEQDADACLFAYRDEYYLEREKPLDMSDAELEAYESRLRAAHNRLEIIVAKQRQGPVGTAKVFCNVAFNRIWEADT